MAQQESIIKLKGRIGDLTFYKTRDGYQVREAKGIDPNRIATDPRFQRTRENGAEFGRAIGAGKLFRRAVRPVILTDADAKMANRMDVTRSAVKRYTEALYDQYDVHSRHALVRRLFETGVRG